MWGAKPPHILEGSPGPPGPARPQKRTPKNRPDRLQVPRNAVRALMQVRRGLSNSRTRLRGGAGGSRDFVPPPEAGRPKSVKNGPPEPCTFGVSERPCPGKTAWYPPLPQPLLTTADKNQAEMCLHTLVGLKVQSSSSQMWRHKASCCLRRTLVLSKGTLYRSSL